MSSTQLEIEHRVKSVFFNSDTLKSLFVLVGVVLLFAAFSKMKETCFFQHLQYSPIFIAGLLLDLILGSTLLFASPTRGVAKVSAAVFFIYLLFLCAKLLSNQVHCECFGTKTPILFPLVFDVSALLFFTFCAFKVVPAQSRWQEIVAPFCMAVFVGMVLFFAATALKRFEAEVYVKETEVHYEEGETVAKIKFKIENSSGDNLRLVGFPASCKFKIDTPLPLSVAGGNSEDLLLRINRSEIDDGFLSGRFTVFVESRNKVGKRTYRRVLPWCASNFDVN